MGQEYELMLKWGFSFPSGVGFKVGSTWAMGKTDGSLVYSKSFRGLIANKVLFVFKIIVIFALMFILGRALTVGVESVIGLDLSDVMFGGVIERILVVFSIVLFILIARCTEIGRSMVQFHGAEHMVVEACSGSNEVILDVAREQPMVVDGCGSVFYGLYLAIWVLIPAFLQDSETWGGWYVPISLLLSFLSLKFSGNGKLYSVLTFPGMLLQRLVVKKPSDEQLKVALRVLNSCIEREMEVERVKDEIIRKYNFIGEVHKDKSC